MAQHGLLRQIWAMREDALERLLSHVNGTRELTGRDIAAEKDGGGSRSGNIAVLNLFGPIEQRLSWIGEMFGGTGTEAFGATFDTLMADKSIKAIVLNVDSPGGTVNGVEELSQKIFDARGGKKIIAVANSDMASAAYYVASAADEIVVSPSGEVGSIGVIAVHVETSKMDESIGWKATVIKAGKYKWEANPYEPLSDEARDSIQASVDRYYGMFTKAVARNRGTTAGAVKAGYGQGRMLGAADAVEAGLADRVDTLESVLSKLGAGGYRMRRKTDAIKPLDLV